MEFYKRYYPILRKHGCGCLIIELLDHTYDTVYCPLHKAAPELYEALKQLLVDYQVICERKPKNTVLQTRLIMAQNALSLAKQELKED